MYKVVKENENGVGTLDERECETLEEAKRVANEMVHDGSCRFTAIVKKGLSVVYTAAWYRR